MPWVTPPSCLSLVLSSRAIQVSLLPPSFPGLCTYLSIGRTWVYPAPSPDLPSKTRSAHGGLFGGQTSPYKLGAMAVHSFTCPDAHMTPLLCHSWSSFILGVAAYGYFFSNKYAFDTSRQLFQKQTNKKTVHIFILTMRKKNHISILICLLGICTNT